MAAPTIATTSQTTTSQTTAPPAGTGRWSHPNQRMLTLLAFGVIVGSFMPWVETALGTYRGFAGPGQYLFYAGVLGFAGGLVPVRSLAIAQGAILATVAVFMPVWQIVKLTSKVGFEGWAPGVGLMVVLGCGLMALRTTVLLTRDC